MRTAAPSLFAILIAASTCQAGETLRWKWTEGDSNRLLMEQTMDMTMNGGPMGPIKSNTDQKMLMTWTVQKGGDSAEVSQSTNRIVMNMNGPMGQGFTYDSAAGTAPVGMAAMVAPMFDALVSADIVLAVNTLGAVNEVTIPEGLKQAFSNVPGGAVSTDMVTQMSQQGMLKFPEDPIEVGDTWTESNEVSSPQMGAMKINVTYRFDGMREVDGRTVAVISPKLDMQVADPNGQAMPVTFETRESGGEILFDNEAGRLVSSRIEQTTDVVVSIQGQEMRNAITQTTTVRALGADENPELGAEASLAEPAGAAP